MFYVDFIISTQFYLKLEICYGFIVGLLYSAMFRLLTLTLTPNFSSPLSEENTDGVRIQSEKE